MRVAIIPARGGSKRIPRKNIKRFAGQPIIGYAIDAALSCPEIDRVIVSTDDDEIADIALERGAELPFRRPIELADDHTSTVPVVAHAIERCEALGWKIDEVCCIYPAVPFIEIVDLQRSLAVLGSGAGYVFPIAEFPSPIQRALRLGDDAAIVPVDPRHSVTRTQDIERAYYDVGQFYWGAREAWLQRLHIHHNGRGVVIPAWRAIDIDTEDDWIRAELLYRALNPGREAN